jgi:hypothetical protein
LIARESVAGSQLLALTPEATVTLEDVHRTLVQIAPVIVSGRAHDERVAMDRDVTAEAVTGGAIVGRELLLFNPASAVALEDVDGALVGVGANVIAGDSHDERRATDGKGNETEHVICRAIARDERLLSKWSLARIRQSIQAQQTGDTEGSYPEPSRERTHDARFIRAAVAWHGGGATA